VPGRARMDDDGRRAIRTSAVSGQRSAVVARGVAH
jgi:hypothetical protein